METWCFTDFKTTRKWQQDECLRNPAKRRHFCTLANGHYGPHECRCGKKSKTRA